MSTHYKVYRDEIEHRWSIVKTNEPIPESSGKCECLENKPIYFKTFQDAENWCKMLSKKSGEEFVVGY